MKFGVLLAAALSLRGQGGLDFPRVGEILDVSTGSVRELRGLAGAFTLGPSKNEGAVSLGCNGRICLTKTADRIISTSRTDAAAPAGPAIFGFDGDHALIYFPGTRQFARWSESGLQLLDWSVDGEVLAVRPRGDDADIVVRRDSEVWISSVTGELHRALPLETVAALLLPSGVVYATSNAVVFDDRKQIDVQGVEALYELDAAHVIARAGGRLFLISLDRGEIFELPGGGA